MPWRFAIVALLWTGVQCAAQQPHLTKPDAFFDDPARLCGALADQGIEMQDWHTYNSFPRRNAPYFCEGRQSAIKKGRLDSDTIYRVSGDHSSNADIISISVTVPEAGDLPAGLDELTRYVDAIFKAIDKPQPIALTRSMKSRAYYMARQPYGVLWFNVVRPMDHPKEHIFWFRLSKREVESTAVSH